MLRLLARHHGTSGHAVLAQSMRTSAVASAESGFFSRIKEKILGGKKEDEVAGGEVAKPAAPGTPAKPFIHPRQRKVVFFPPIEAPTDVPTNPAQFITSLTQEVAASLQQPLSGDVASTPLDSARFKFKVLTKCQQDFKRQIPNYRLDDMKTVGDVIAYFEEPFESQIRMRDRPLFHSVDKQSVPSNLRIFV